MGKSGNFNKLFERKIFNIPSFQPDLSFHQNAISWSQGSFSEVRKTKIEKSGHPGTALELMLIWHRDHSIFLKSNGIGYFCYMCLLCKH